MPIFVPVATSLAGSVLMAEDWRRIHIHTLSVAFDTLLVKPGLRALQQYDALQTYLGWDGHIVLDARNIHFHQGLCKIRSIEDGRMHTLEASDILAWVERCSPELCLWPLSCMASMPCALEPDDPSYHQVWCEDDTMLDVKCLYQICESIMHEGVMQKFPQHVKWVSSDEPARLGLAGQVWNAQGKVVSVLASWCATCFEVLDASCSCEACQTGLTFAYFHHLYQHTPGLCQRFLVQHNVAYCARFFDECVQ